MKVYFVIDLLNGVVVRAVKGERAEYRPIHTSSKILNTSDSVQVIEKIKLRYLYVADLDRITGKGDNVHTIEKLSEKVSHLIADCGFRSADELNVNFDPVLGTETFDVRRLDEVELKLRRNVFVSLDIKGRLLDSSGSFTDWRNALEWLNSFKLGGVIVLTLHKVGTASSLDFDVIEEAVGISDNPVFAGGGVKDVNDLLKAESVGCDGVLVATAVHERVIPLEIVRRGKI